jgi:hypothetical protein
MMAKTKLNFGTLESHWLGQKSFICNNDKICNLLHNDPVQVEMSPDGTPSLIKQFSVS